MPISSAVPGAVDALRLLRDERADLREPPRDHRRRRLRVRRARLRHGVPAPTSRRPGRTRSGRSRRRARSWRRSSRSSAAASSWTPIDRSTRRRTRSTSAPARRRRSTSRVRPGSNPRTDSLIAVDLRTGQLKWWQQQMAHNEWSYDTAQPPLVYNGEGRRQEARASSRSRRWKASGSLRRGDRAADLPARQGDRPHRAPAAPAGQAGRRLSRRRSAASTSRPPSYDPKTNYIFNAAAETAARDDPEEADADAEEAQALARRHLPRARRTATSAQYLPGWHDHGSISAIDVEHRPARLEVPRRPSRSAAA